MGRSTPTFREQMEKLRSKWERYRRALRRQHKQRFDHMWTRATRHNMAGNSLNARNPQDALWMGIALSQQREIDELRERLEDLEEKGAEL